MRLTLIPALLLIAAGCAEEQAIDDTPWWDTDVTAAQIWGATYDEDARGGVALADDGTMALGSPGGSVYVGDPFTGDLARIDVDADNPSTTPIIAEGAVLVRGTDGTLVAIDPETETELWSSVDHMPVLTDNTLVMQRNTLDPALIARDPVTGEVLWTIEDDALVSRPLDARDGRVCGSSAESELSMIDAADGTELWRVQPGPMGNGPSIYTCTVLADGGALVLGASDEAQMTTELVRYSAAGEELARRQVFDGQESALAATAREDGFTVVWSNQSTELLDADLELVDSWNDRTPRAVDPQTGNMLYGWTLVDADWAPIWRAEVGTPTHAYRFEHAVVVGTTAYVTDGQDGVLGTDRWSRTLVLGLP